MEGLRQYILAVISMAMLGGIVLLLFRSGPYEGTVKLITGLMVTVTVVAPLMKDSDISFSRLWEGISTDGSAAVSHGEKAAKTATSVYIKESMETYISNKAKEMGAEISAEVKLQDDILQVPEEITLIGEISPYLKVRLSETIQSEIGISEENQIWISRN